MPLRKISYDDAFAGYRRIAYLDPATGETLYVEYALDELVGEPKRSRNVISAWLTSLLF